MYKMFRLNSIENNNILKLSWLKYMFCMSSISSYYCTRRIILILSYFVAVIMLLCSYYLYLDKLYLVDEVLDVHNLRELTIDEKVTIRVGD